MNSVSDEKIMLDILHKKASECVKMKKMSEAVLHLNKIIEIDPRDFSAYFKIAQIAFAARQYDKAEEMSQKAAMFAPNDIRPWIIMASIYTATADFDKLINQIPFALTIEPENFQLNYLIGYAMAKKGFFDKAQRYLDVALKIKPDNMQAVQAMNIVKQVLAKMKK